MQSFESLHLWHTRGECKDNRPLCTGLSFLGKQGRHLLSVSKSRNEWGLWGGGSLSLLYKCWNKAVGYINAEIKQSARKGFTEVNNRTVKEWFGKFQAKIPIEYLGMIWPKKFTLPFCPGCRGLHWISHTKLSECSWYARGGGLEFLCHIGWDHEFTLFPVNSSE
jgi:hypothetical protein